MVLSMALGQRIDSKTKVICAPHRQSLRPQPAFDQRWPAAASAWYSRFLGSRIFLSVLTWVALSLPSLRADDSLPDRDLKAALLYNFTQFVDWPERAFANPEAPFVIGIVGHDPFGLSLEKIVDHERANGHRITVQHCHNMAEAEECHLLYIDVQERDSLEKIIRSLDSRPILTVAEFDGFLGRGGMVRLYRNPENKIRVRMNLESVRSTGLSISAKLLRVVEVAVPEEE
jgi:hypothetical protein